MYLSNFRKVALVIILKQCRNSDLIPYQWKVAYIMSIYKNDSRKDRSNYPMICVTRTGEQTIKISVNKQITPKMSSLPNNIGWESMEE